MNASFTILYQETKGAENTELGRDGVTVALTSWHTEVSFSVAKPHFLIEKTVIVDGEYVVNTTSHYSGYGYTDAEMIRKAIAEFDKLVEAHPTLGGGE